MKYKMWGENTNKKYYTGKVRFKNKILISRIKKITSLTKINRFANWKKI
jgi:hypothetical protein